MTLIMLILGNRVTLSQTSSFETSPVCHQFLSDSENWSLESDINPLLMKVTFHQHFPFPTTFFTLSRKNLSFCIIFNVSFANSFKLDQSQTRAITERDHTPYQRIVIEQVLVTEWRMV